MNKKFIFIFFILLCPWVQFSVGFTDCKLLLGTIELPRHFTTSTSVRIWRSGLIIPCDTDTRGKTISFELSIDRGQTFLYLVVVNDIVPSIINSTVQSIEDNTVKYFSIGPAADYKVFSLEYVTQQQEDKQTSLWMGKELNISLSRIPDDAVIIYIPGYFIDHLESGSSFELPKIVFNKNLSETQTIDILTQQLLKAINYDLLHANIIREVKQNQLTTLVTFNT